MLKVTLLMLKVTLLKLGLLKVTLLKLGLLKLRWVGLACFRYKFCTLKLEGSVCYVNMPVQRAGTVFSKMTETCQ